MKNYKKIRQEPYMYGFTMVGFIAFSITTILSLLTLLMGFSFVRCVISLILIGVSYLVCKYLLSSDKVTAFLFDNKLPKKYSQYE